MISRQITPRRWRVRALALQAFEALECSGMARVDFFLDRQTGDFYRQRGQHPAGLHLDQHVPADDGGLRVPIGAADALVELALERHGPGAGGLTREFEGLEHFPTGGRRSGEENAAKSKI